MSVDRILLVSLDNLGDLVFASALAPPLRERFPGASIDIWCKEYTSDIARLVPGVRDVIGSDPFWDRAPGRAKGTLRPFVRAMRAVHAHRYDLALLAAAPWRTAAAVALTGIPRRIGLERHRNRFFLTEVVPDEDAQKPVLAELARLLSPLGMPQRTLYYRLERTPLSSRRERLAARLPARFVALHPFASKRSRCVPLSIWVELAQRLAARGLGTLWVGSGPELDELRQSVAHETWRFVDRDSDGSLADSAAALSLASLFVGHDSGPLHIAGAFGIPVVGIFAPGEPLRTFPQGVGPSRMLARPSPDGVSAADILREIDALVVERDA